MKNIFKTGDIKTITITVTPDKLAKFDAGMVHEVYSTFDLAKDVEWACRLFVLDMLEEGEEGVGAHISIDHISPAVLGSTVTINAIFIETIGNKVGCIFEATIGQRVIAKGKQTQKIINKAKFDALIQQLKDEL